MTDLTAFAQDHIESIFGADYFFAEERGTRYLSERDFPVADTDDSEMTMTDWEFVAEMTYVDPMERHF